MARSLEKIKSGLKLRTNAKEGALSLKLGVRKAQLPFETRLVQSDEYIFVHVPPSAEIFRIDGKRLIQVETVEEAEKAMTSFKKSRKKGGRTKKNVTMPSDLEQALAKIPDGFRLGYDANGEPRLVRTRQRRK